MSQGVPSTYIVPMGQSTQHWADENPQNAMSEYARIMHEHTKAQLSSATSSARRRSQASDASSTSSSHSPSSVNASPS